MKKALERLDSLIIKRIDPLHIEKTNYSDEQLFYCLITASEECDKIRLHLLSNAGKLKERTELERLFRHYQSSLVYLMDRLFSYKKKQSNPTLNRMYDSVSAGVGELLQYFKIQFAEFFNVDGKVPDTSQVISQEALQADWNFLQQLIAGQGVHDELIKAVTEPITIFLTGKFSDDVTYRWLGYMEDLWEQLSEWANGRHDDPEWELISLILYMNLNSRKCRAYCINYIVGFTDNLYDANDKLDRLEWLLKRTRLIQVKPDTAFDGKQKTSLKEHIEEWILTEIGFAKSKAVPPTEKIALKNDTVNEVHITHKILSGLTVEEQGAWTETEMVAGKILNETAAEVHRIISMTHETLGSANPSAGNMARKSKALKERSITKMRRMLKLMDEEFKRMLDG